MASVQYLLDFNRDFSQELQQVQYHFSKLLLIRNANALILQRQWKRYASKKHYQKIRFAIITIQRFCRGWQIRKGRDRFVLQHAEDMDNLRCLRSAVTIQAWWRGTLVRLYMHNRLPAVRIQERKRMREASEKMAAHIREVQRMHRLDAIAAEEQRSQAEVKEILYQSRYLLRTSVREGVCSIHGSDRLSLIESLMKALPCKTHMDDLKKLYHKLSAVPPKHEYTFSTRKLRTIEDLLRNAHPFKIETASDDFPKFDKKRFSLSPKITRTDYIPSITNGNSERVLKKKKTNDPRLKKLEDNFTLSSRNGGKQPTNPYYIDFWEKCFNKKEC